jgi:hypothetical protein
MRGCDIMKKFIWGVVFGIILVPVVYIGRLVKKYRSEKVHFDDTEWP